MRIGRRLLAIPAVLAAAVTTLVVAAQPAAAFSYNCTADGGSQVCINVTAAGVNADVEVVTDTNFHSPTVAALQCSGTGSDCVEIAANSDVGHLWLSFATSVKPYSSGHTYKAIASWIDPSGVSHVAIQTGLACCP